MKYVYSFKEGNKNMKDLLGGKGANLCEMTNLKLPVPQGFIITTEACQSYYENGKNINENIIKEIYKKIKRLEKETGKKFQDKEKPLLVSVRSGARSSMPGMMDTILNLGLNDEVVKKLETKMDKRFIYDCYRRFIQMYSDVVKGLDKKIFEDILEKAKKENNVKSDFELTADNLKKIIKEFKNTYQKLTNETFPEDPKIQLIEAVKAVFRSWNNERAKFYRKMNNIPDSWGTAVNVQEMVYGNLNNDSLTGVVFTRNPATGENKLYGEFLVNAQGEDIVSGVRTPENIESLEKIMPECYKKLKEICTKLEKHYKDMQDMEFTIENKKLYILQTRNGKRTATAAVKIAIDLVKENIITKEEAILNIEPKLIENLLHPTFDDEDLKTKKLLATGLAASPGSGSGKIFFSYQDLKKAYEKGEKDLILVRLETSSEDIEGMSMSKAVLTLRGGMTSHAAVVARGMGIPCISGCESLKIDEVKKELITKDEIIKEGEYLSIDATTGKVYKGKTKTKECQTNEDFKTFINWAKELSKVKVRANADNYKDAKTALSLGAAGIGLCRTEHMFFEKERIFNFRKMILSKNEQERQKALDNIMPYQKEDFKKLFEVMNGYPVTIRLLDPPLHEFLPKEEMEKEELANDLNITKEEIEKRIKALKEFNPMMGHRGCRLSITYPEIAIMQTKAIISASISAKKEGIEVLPEIMIPLVGEVKELKYLKEIIKTEIEKIIEKEKVKINYLIGTMVEVPRGALTADEIAKEADFFSFGTNDLTQMTYGYSRDDSAKFLNDYYEKHILDFNPFEKLDQKGVGLLIKQAMEKGKKENKNLELGICGEQGADPESIKFLADLKIDYVSCSPYRIPVALISSARAKILNKNK